MFINRKHKPETIEKMRKAAIGRKKSELHKQHIKETHPHSWLGRKHTEETKNKIGLVHKNKKVSEETRKKLRDRMIESGRFSGEKNPNWKGGITRLYMKIRTCDLYRQWRLSVFRRDEFKCQECGDNRGHNLNADHIKPFSVILSDRKITSFKKAQKCDELWDIDNGCTLCEDCHKNTETFGTKVYNYNVIT